MIRSRQDERVIIEFDDTTRAWNDWKHGNIIPKSLIHERYILSLVECTKMYTTYDHSLESADQLVASEPLVIPPLVKQAPGRHRNCQICRRYQSQLYPCRTCGKVYHQECIKDIGDMKSYPLIKHANHALGWSCPICEDLQVLLPSAELAETNEWIKSLGTQPIYTLNYYINTRMQSKSSVNLDESTSHVGNILQNFLSTIKDMTPNRLFQSDLFTLDIYLKVLRTSSKTLVHFLTQFELYRLSQLFLSLSSVDNPRITPKNFEQILQRYFQTVMPEITSDEKHSHLEALAYTFMDHSSNFDRTWSQFLLDATIPTLFGRLNHRSSVDFLNRIISIQHSTSRSPLIYRDSQSISKLIQNVLHKLRQTIENESESVKAQHQKKHIKTKRQMNERTSR